MARYLTSDFWKISLGNFFLFLSFYALMPLLPFYLEEKFSAGGSITGFVLGAYMIALIAVRPVAGYLLDAFSRKPIYVISYVIFSFIFLGYGVSAAIAVFVLLRAVHGSAFGVATVSGSTLISQIVPKEHLGEGLGIYGLANTLSMCLGPMLAMYAYGNVSYDVIFTVLVIVALLGALVAMTVRVPDHLRASRHITADSFILSNGWWMSLSQCLSYIPYGASMSYVAVYARELGLEGYGGLYFTFMAVGLGIARPLSGRLADRRTADDENHGAFRLTISGMTLGCVTFLLLGLLHYIGAGSAPFLCVAFMQGVTYGILHPTYNTLFVRLAPEDRRGAANSMCQTSNDVGNGIGMIVGSGLAAWLGGFHMTYLVSSALIALGLYVFMHKARAVFPR